MHELLLAGVGQKKQEPVEYPNSGPGTKMLILGDENVGYFGLVPQAELFTAPALRTAVGLTSGTQNVWTGNWIKMFSRGKVIFFPDMALNNDISWASLYLAGITSGRDNIDAAGASTPTIQRKVVTHGDRQLVVRLFHGAPSYLADIPATLNMGIADARLGYSEWGQIICRLNTEDTPGWTGERWKLFPPTSLMGTTTVSSAANRWAWCSPDSMAGFQVNYQHMINNNYINAIRDNRTIYLWYPVLELIDQ
jgi:hypothetical protein